MVGATAHALRRYARGEISGQAVREATGLTYPLLLAGLSELGLRPPRASFTGPNGPALRRGHELVFSALVDSRRG